ncbi:hypothetical protein STCU_11982 [Strigomonas culicis]|uniref:Uncharacterized protein n=1 Tax=Strigomonas culicis TaxID=28005 RepID=S9ULB9_9TRYP|nr:hypothetical protein STCU_11982 [Strigomonas culicis]|eukprot:EPY15491.1 hypothetical protein STCU_11982 [Strigomonas culicis]
MLSSGDASAAPALDHVTLLIPLHHYFRGGATEDLMVTPSCGEFSIVAPNPSDAQFKCVCWHIPLITAHMNKEGTIEIQLQDHNNNNSSHANGNEELFFPIQVQFASSVSLGRVDVKEVVNSDNGKGVEYGVTTSLIAENYDIS